MRTERSRDAIMNVRPGIVEGMNQADARAPSDWGAMRAACMRSCDHDGRNAGRRRCGTALIFAMLMAGVGVVSVPAFGQKPSEGKEEKGQKVSAQGQQESNPPRAKQTRRRSPSKKGARRPSSSPAKTRSKRSEDGDSPSRQAQTARGTATRRSSAGPQTSRKNDRPVPFESAPVESAPIDRDVPPEEKQYSFSCVDCTYTQLVDGFARQTGLGVQGQAPKDGKVKYFFLSFIIYESH